MYSKSARVVTFMGGALIFGALTACQPEDEAAPVPPGAIPAAPDVRPGMEAAQGAAARSGAAADSLEGEPRMPVPEGQPSAEQAPQ